MNAFEAHYFGTGERLFGCFHPAAAGNRGVAVLLCAPLFNEYYRCHATLRRLADALANSGCDVLRFDYRGCGDSLGDTPIAPFQAWRDDIGEAIAHLGELSPSGRMTIVSTRFAAGLANEFQSDIARHVAWDPELVGPDYLAQAQQVQAAVFARHPSLSETQIREADFLGSGLTLEQVGESLSCFAAHAAKPDTSIVSVRSEVDWLTPSLGMIFDKASLDQLAEAVLA